MYSGYVKRKNSVAEKRFVKQLQELLGREAVVMAPGDLALYAYDSSMSQGLVPEVVVLPTTTQQVAEVVKLARQAGMPYVVRGAGTNLSGGTVLPKGGMVICLARMDRILEIDTANGCAVVEAGAVNLELQQRLAPLGYQFCPDPASQKAPTIGGNIGENAGGPHCLKYGVTSNHVLGLVVVLTNGEIVRLGGKAPEYPGYDLMSLMIGSEGTLGIITEATLRISPLPRATRTLLAVFDSIEKAGRATRDIIAVGILPAALEIMDRLMIWAVAQAGVAAYPDNAEAVLVVEVDGEEAGLDEQLAKCREICTAAGATELQTGMGEEERERLWQGRRGAAGAGGRIAPGFLVNDGTVPRDKLPETLARMEEIGRRLGVKIGSVFHAGDGNLHPNIYYNPDDPQETHNAHQCALEILQVCAELGGTISGEHGIGMEKMAAMKLVFGAEEMELMRRIKGIMDPEGLCNPGKILE
jgi:glycolate oxidase subunit GlcD